MFIEIDDIWFEDIIDHIIQNRLLPNQDSLDKESLSLNGRIKDEIQSQVQEQIRENIYERGLVTQTLNEVLEEYFEEYEVYTDTEILSRRKTNEED